LPLPLNRRWWCRLSHQSAARGVNYLVRRRPSNRLSLAMLYDKNQDVETVTSRCSDPSDSNNDSLFPILDAHTIARLIGIRGRSPIISACHRVTVRKQYEVAAG